jgi:hypothetical protein
VGIVNQLVKDSISQGGVRDQAVWQEVRPDDRPSRPAPYVCETELQERGEATADPAESWPRVADHHTEVSGDRTGLQRFSGRLHQHFFWLMMNHGHKPLIK